MRVELIIKKEVGHAVKSALFVLSFLCLTMFVLPIPTSYAQGAYDKIIEPVETPIEPCTLMCGCTECGEVIQENTEEIRAVMSIEFQKHRDWLVEILFNEQIRFAMALMTNEMTAIMLSQVEMIGSFFDAKHQLETQRIFQQLMAKAHEDYQPSEGMCDIGTTARGLIISERKTDLVHQAVANRTMQRQLRSGRNLSYLNNSDSISRIFEFREHFCNIRNNSGNLEALCGASAPRINRNRDIDFTRTVDSKLTIDLGFAIDDMVENGDDQLGGQLTVDERAIFALTAHLFAHDPIARPPCVTNRYALLPQKEALPQTQ